MDLRGRGGRLRRIALTHPDQTSLAGPEAASLDARLLGVLSKRGKPVGKADLLRAAEVSREERSAALGHLAALEASGLRAISAVPGGNGVEARAIRPTDERCAA